MPAVWNDLRDIPALLRSRTASAPTEIIIMSKIVIIGAEGQLGAELCRQLGPMALPLTRQQLDITDARQTELVLGQMRSDAMTADIGAVINTAAYTNVDLAEQLHDECRRVNVDGVSNLAKACNQHNLSLVQISSDYVFGAARASQPRPYREDDPTAPQGEYAKSKLAGELAAAQASRHLILRTCGLYGPRSKPTQGNFVDTMLRLGRERDHLRVVDDQTCSPSYIVDVAQATLFLVQSQAQGVFHVVNQGGTTWFEFAREIFRLAHFEVVVEPISTAQYNAPAPRPSYSVLDTAKYDGLRGPALRPWQIALAQYVANALQPTR